MKAKMKMYNKKEQKDFLAKLLTLSISKEKKEVKKTTKGKLNTMKKRTEALFNEDGIYIEHS